MGDRSRSPGRRGPQSGGGPPPSDGGEAAKLYVGNLSFQTRNEDLTDFFSEFGRVVDASVAMERDDPGSCSPFLPACRTASSMCARSRLCAFALAVPCCPLVAVRVPSLRIRNESTTMRRELCAWKCFELDQRRGQQHVPACSCDCHADSLLAKPHSDSDTQLFESEFIGLIDPILPVRPQKNYCGTLGAGGIAELMRGKKKAGTRSGTSSGPLI